MNAVARREIYPTKPEDFNKRYLKPIVHNPSFAQRILYGAQPSTTYDATNLAEFKHKAKGLVSYYQPEQSIEDFPSHSTHVVRVPMSPKQTLMYKFVENKLPATIKWKMHQSLPPTKSESEQLNSFMTAARQIVNTSHEFDVNHSEKFDSPKLYSMLHHIKNSKGPALVYSNYLESGLIPLSKLLKAHGIEHEVFTGALNDKERKSLVEKYNTGRTKALLISSSGAEGLDLKRTRQVHIMEPHWHEPKIDQVIGRAIRYKSHSDLPVEDRHVDIYHYLSTHAQSRPKFLDALRGGNRNKTVDEFLHEMSRQKKTLNSKFLNALKEVSIEHAHQTA